MKIALYTLFIIPIIFIMACGSQLSSEPNSLNTLGRINVAVTDENLIITIEEIDIKPENFMTPFEPDELQSIGVIVAEDNKEEAILLMPTPAKGSMVEFNFKRPTGPFYLDLYANINTEVTTKDKETTRTTSWAKFSLAQDKTKWWLWDYRNGKPYPNYFKYRADYGIQIRVPNLSYLGYIKNQQEEPEIEYPDRCPEWFNIHCFTVKELAEKTDKTDSEIIVANSYYYLYNLLTQKGYSEEADRIGTLKVTFSKYGDSGGCIIGDIIFIPYPSYTEVCHEIGHGAFLTRAEVASQATELYCRHQFKEFHDPWIYDYSDLMRGLEEKDEFWFQYYLSRYIIVKESVLNPDISLIDVANMYSNLNGIDLEYSYANEDFSWLTKDRVAQFKEKFSNEIGLPFF